MAKIDTALIPGFDEMTLEEQVQALTNFEYEDYSNDAKRFKNAISKLTHEAAENKRQNRANEELHKNALDEKDNLLKLLQEKVEAMEKDKNIATTTNEYLNLGYSKEDATLAATAIVNGDMASLFSLQKKHQDELITKVKQDSIINTPQPNTLVGNSIDKTAFNKLSYNDRLKLYNENPELYNQLSK